MPLSVRWAGYLVLQCIAGFYIDAKATNATKYLFNSGVVLFLSPMIIDFQSHYMPKSYLSILNQITRINPVERYAMLGDLADLEKRIRIMNKLSIDAAVIGSYGWNEPLDPVTELRASKASNDEIAEIISHHHGRFIGLATLPCQNIGESSLELERAITQLGLSGIWLPSNIKGITLDSATLFPIYEKCSKFEIPVFIHPTYPITFGSAAVDAMQQYGLTVTLGMLYDSSFSVLRLILSGVLDKFSGLKLVMPHLGGVLPYLIGRIDKGWRRYKSEIQNPPSDYLKRIYVDTVSDNPAALSCALSIQGANRIVFGTDYPYWEMENSISFVRSVNTSNEEKEMIFHKNAESILKL